jgi:hypothetical protein
VAQKPSYLTGGAGPSGHLSAKRGTEDLDYFIGDEALAQGSGPGTNLLFCWSIKEEGQTKELAWWAIPWTIMLT